MRKVVLVLSILLIGCVAAQAQTPKPFDIYVGGGITIPNSPDFVKDEYANGFHGYAGLGLKIPAVMGLQVLGKVQYHMMPSDFSEGFQVDGQDITDGGDFRFLMFGVDGLYRMGTPGGLASPFASFGIGFANSSLTDYETASGDVEAEESSTDFYWNIAAGADLQITPGLRFFGQLSYVSISTEGDAIALIPITIGVKF